MSNSGSQVTVKASVGPFFHTFKKDLPLNNFNTIIYDINIVIKCHSLIVQNEHIPPRVFLGSQKGLNVNKMKILVIFIYQIVQILLHKICLIIPYHMVIWLNNLIICKQYLHVVNVTFSHHCRYLYTVLVSNCPKMILFSSSTQTLRGHFTPCCFVSSRHKN